MSLNFLISLPSFCEVSVKRAIVTGFAFISMETKTNQIVNDYPKATERNNLNTRNGILKNETAENQHFGRPRILFMFPYTWIWVGSVYSNSEIIHWMNPYKNSVYCFGLWASYTSYLKSISLQRMAAIYELFAC